MAMRIAELRKSECCPVIGQIEVALPFLGTTLLRRKRSRLLGGAQTRERLQNQYMKQSKMTTAQAVGAASHTTGGFIHRRASWPQTRIE
jgi:hypothetical protein